MNKDKVVKCACGLPMRQHEWADHWRGCRFGCKVKVTPDDIKNLEAYEELKQDDVRRNLGK